MPIGVALSNSRTLSVGLKLTPVPAFWSNAAKLLNVEFTVSATVPVVVLAADPSGTTADVRTVSVPVVVLEAAASGTR